MTNPDLLLAAATRLLELRRECPDCPPTTPGFVLRKRKLADCPRCHGRGWVPQKPHLEDVLAMMAKRGLFPTTGTRYNYNSEQWESWIVFADAKTAANIFQGSRVQAADAEAWQPERWTTAALQAAMATKEA